MRVFQIGRRTYRGGEDTEIEVDCGNSSEVVWGRKGIYAKRTIRNKN